MGMLLEERPDEESTDALVVDSCVGAVGEDKWLHGVGDTNVRIPGLVKE